VPRLGIDKSGHGQTTAGYRVGIFLLDYYAVWQWLVATGYVAQPASSPRNRQKAGKMPAKLSSCFLLSLSRARLSMAILVARIDADFAITHGGVS